MVQVSHIVLHKAEIAAKMGGNEELGQPRSALARREQNGGF
jgi:hypothetical protein